MDKAEYRIKLDQITELRKAGDYKNALPIVDEIDWRRVKSARTLCMVSEIYEDNGRLQDSRRVLELAYKRALVKTVVYRLVEVCLKLNDYESAEEYYEDFADLAPTDDSKYILQYKIRRAKGEPVSKQIEILEKYKEREYTEEWAYELAELYSQAGDVNACVEACDDLILWFSEGPYVLKAMELKRKYAPLSPSQQKKYKQEKSQAETVKTVIPSFLNSQSDTVQEEKVQSEKPTEEQMAEQIEEEEERLAAMRAEAAIEKMDAAASSTVQSDSGIKIPQGMGSAVDVKPAMDPARMQSQLADSIRNVFAGINNRGTVQLDTQASKIEEKYEDLYQQEEDMTGYEIKDLEPETTDGSVTTLETLKKDKPNDDQIQGQMTLEDITKKETEFDFEALFAETTNALAMELASGAFTKMDTPVDTEAEETVRKAAEEEAARKAAEEEAARKAAEEENELQYERETDESLGLTREFNFREELKKAMSADFEEDDVKEYVKEADKKAAEKSEKEVVKEAEKEEIDIEKIPVKMEEKNLAEELEAIFAAEERFSFEGMLEKNLAEAEIDVAEEAKKAAEKVTLEKAEEDAEEEVQEEIQEEIQEDVQDEISVEIPEEIQNLNLESEMTPMVEEEAAEESENGGITFPDDFEITFPMDEIEKSEEKAAEEEVIQEELITDPEKVVLSDESEKILKYIPVEPRPLTEKEREIFTYFAGIPGLSQQITETLCDVHNNAGDKTSKSGNFLLIGRQGAGKTRLYESMVLAICKDLDIKAVKMAKVIARDFNGKDPAAVVAKLAGGFLVIEGAGELNDETAEKLSQAMEFRTDSLVVVLEDEKDDLYNMLDKHPDLASKFTSKIKIPVFTNDELVTFARTYALEQGYKIDEMGILALYTKIGDNQKDAEPVTVGKVKAMMDAAMLHANRGHRKLSRRFSKNAVDDENRIILFEKDFE